MGQQQAAMIPVTNENFKREKRIPLETVRKRNEKGFCDIFTPSFQQVCVCFATLFRPEETVVMGGARLTTTTTTATIQVYTTMSRESNGVSILQ